MKNLQDRLDDFRPPKDWQSDIWEEKIAEFDPDYERVLVPWLETLSPDMIHHYVRGMDLSQGMTDRYVAYWIIDWPNLDHASARLLFWKLIDQHPYHGSSDDLEDDEHGVPELTKALLKLADRMHTGNFINAELAVTAAELENPLRRFAEMGTNALERNWDPGDAPFAISSEWSSPIAGRPPAVPTIFPAPKDPIVAAFLMSSNFPTRKEMYRLAEKYDVVEGSDRMILWTAYAACALLVGFTVFKIAL